MELSLELFQSTIRALRSDPVEKRLHPRVPIRVRVKIVPYKAGILQQPLEVWTLDISAGGLGLISSEPLRVGEQFVLRLPRYEGGHTYLVCTTRNCTMQVRGTYVVGSSFVEETIMPCDDRSE